MKTRPLRFGLVGCGHIVEEGHLSAYFDCHQDLVVIAIADPQSVRRDSIGEKIGIRSSARYSNYREMFNKEDLDIIVVSTPPDLHKEVVTTSLKYGYGVICEKPLSLNYSEALTIQQLILEENGFFAILHNYCYRPGWKNLIEQVQGGVIGRPLMLQIQEMSSGFWPDYSGNKISWRIDYNKGGGPLWDNLYHACYLAEELFEMPIETADALLINLTGRYEVEDTAVLHLFHENGAFSQAICSWGYTGKPFALLSLIGERGIIKYSYWEQPDLIQLEYPNTSKVISVPDWNERKDWGYHMAFQEIVQAYCSGQSPSFSISDAIKVIRVLEMASMNATYRHFDSNLNTSTLIRQPQEND